MQRSAASGGCITERDDAPQVENRRRARRVQDAQGDRRAGLRTDQRTTRFSPLQPARQTERQPRVEAGVFGEQSLEALQVRMGTAGGIKTGKKCTPNTNRSPISPKRRERRIPCICL